MRFEWDTTKDAANLRKHGVGFREAAEIFRGLVWSGKTTGATTVKADRLRSACRR
jgi:uncharacterized DUF497 family protein